MKEKIGYILFILSIISFIYATFLFADQSMMEDNSAIYITNNDTGITTVITKN